MTDNELEDVIKKASSIRFENGRYSEFFDEIPANVGLVFKHEDSLGCIQFWKYLNTECKGVNISAHFIQTAIDKINLTLLIDKAGGIVLTVDELLCKPDRADIFFKKQPPDKPLFLFIHINEHPDTLENMAALAELKMDANTGQPIQIHRWKGTPLGTSL